MALFSFFGGSSDGNTGFPLWHGLAETLIATQDSSNGSFLAETLLLYTSISEIPTLLHVYT